MGSCGLSFLREAEAWGRSRPCFPWSMPLPPHIKCGISSCAGFADPASGSPQSTYLDEGPGTSVSRAEGQTGSYLVTQAPEFTQR